MPHSSLPTVRATDLCFLRADKKFKNIGTAGLRLADLGGFATHARRTWRMRGRQHGESHQSHRASDLQHVQHVSMMISFISVRRTENGFALIEYSEMANPKNPGSWPQATGNLLAAAYLLSPPVYSTPKYPIQCEYQPKQTGGPCYQQVAHLNLGGKTGAFHHTATQQHLPEKNVQDMPLPTGW